MVRVIPQSGRPVPLPARVRLAAEILASYARLFWTLRRRGAHAAAARARRSTSTGGIGGIEPPVARRLASIVERTLRPLPTDTRCLVRSLVVVEILHRRGAEVRLVIGATAPSGPFAAHAWVELDGAPIMPSGGASFHRLLEI